LTKRDLEKYFNDFVNLEFEETQMRYRRKIVTKQIKKYMPIEVLEIGCGFNPLNNDFKSINFTIVEPIKKFIDFAKKNDKHGNATFYHSTIEEFSEVKKYDFIVVSCLLHEIKNKENFLQSIKRFCNENTIVHFNVPNALSFHRVLASSMGIIASPYSVSETQLRMQQDNFVFDLDSLKKYLLNFEFEAFECGSYFLKPFSHHQMHQLSQTGFITEKMLDGFNKIIEYFPSNGSEIFVNCRVHRDA
jgi:ubiquinone/menaquinone biosynthesis C-methylase UbiE